MPARAARSVGHDVRVIMPAERDGIGGAVETRTGKLVDLQYPADADVIVMQRVALDSLSQAVGMLRGRGVAVVVDMDDYLTRIDPSNPAFWGFREDAGSPLHNARNVERACTDATLVTVSTPRLLSVYAKHGRGLVLENRVPAWYLDVPHEDLAAVGWAGAIHSHPRDLEELGPSVARIVRDGWEYWGAGVDYTRDPADNGLRVALGLAGDHDLRCDVGTTGAIDLQRWPYAVASMGVGLAPLADTVFNEAKSWLKPLEYMALGLPWIGSPRAEYRRLQRMTGTGQLVEEPRRWYAAMKRLMTDKTYRREQSEQGRAAVREHSFGFTYEQACWRWVEAWDLALRLQRNETNSVKTLVA